MPNLRPFNLSDLRPTPHCLQDHRILSTRASVCWVPTSRLAHRLSLCCSHHSGVEASRPTQHLITSHWLHGAWRLISFYLFISLSFENLSFTTALLPFSGPSQPWWCLVQRVCVAECEFGDEGVGQLLRAIFFFFSCLPLPTSVFSTIDVV